MGFARVQSYELLAVTGFVAGMVLPVLGGLDALPPEQPGQAVPGSKRQGRRSSVAQD